MNNNNNNNISGCNNNNSQSPNISAVRNNNSNNNQITLPPISSFDKILQQPTSMSMENNVSNKAVFLPAPAEYRPSYMLTTARIITPPSPTDIKPDRLYSFYTNKWNYNQLQNTSLKAPMIYDKYNENNVDSSKKIQKNRKKKQCQICNLYFANLATHKSTHLTSENRPHKCPTCQRGFARNNDLIRHKKRHWKDGFTADNGIIITTNSNRKFDNSMEGSNNAIKNSRSKKIINKKRLMKTEQLKSLLKIKGAFKCPYNKTLVELDLDMSDSKSTAINTEQLFNCHQTGVFSRCDTYKNHLKALHFQYPPKTKKEERSSVPGSCKFCGKHFPDVEIWLNTHVNKTCGYSYN